MNASANRSNKPSLGRLAPVAFMVLLTVVIFAVFAPLLNSEFVNFDDPHYIVDNPRVSEGLTGENWKWAWTASHIGNWHPLTWISHMLDCEIFGLRAGGHHLTSILWHTLNSLLLFACLRRMTAAFWRSALVTWIFALHPLHVESVAWIAERKDVLSTFFGLASLWFYIGFVQGKRAGASSRATSRSSTLIYTAALIAFAFSLMSKAMLVTFPFVLLLLDFWPLRRMGLSEAEKPGERSRERISTLIIEKLPFFVLSLISCLITFYTQNSGGAVQSIEKYSLGDRLANTLLSYVRYLGKTVWPTDLAVFYPYQDSNLGLLAAAFVLLLAVTLFAVRVRKQDFFVAIGWFWFLGALVPVIGIVQVGEQAMADRYTYWPLIGLFIAVVWFVHSRLEGLWQKTALFVGVSISLILTVVTHAQVKHWRNSETLFQHAVSVTKDNYIAHNTLGLEYMERGDMERAKLHFSQAVTIRAHYADPLCNLGSILAQEGNLAEAERLFNEALTANPTFEQAHYNLGNLYRSQGDTGRARMSFLATIEINPDNADAHSNLGMIAVQSGDMEMAARHFREVTRINPTDAAAFFNLGLAIANLGDVNGARQLLETALKLRSDFPEAQRELSKLAGP